MKVATGKAVMEYILRARAIFPRRQVLLYSPQGIEDTVRVIFANNALIKQYGQPRSQEECSRLMTLSPEAVKEKRRALLSVMVWGQLLLLPFSRLCHSLSSPAVCNQGRPVCRPKMGMKLGLTGSI